MQGATSGSDDNASSGGGWRAVASHADELQMCEQVGQGAVATVYRALWRGSEVAVKVWDLPPDGFVVHGMRGGTIDVDAPEASFLREVELLSSLRHPNILAIYALVKQPPQMIMEYLRRVSERPSCAIQPGDAELAASAGHLHVCGERR